MASREVELWLRRSRLAGARAIAGGEKEQGIGDAEANALVAKPYRSPWKLEV